MAPINFLPGKRRNAWQWAVATVLALAVLAAAIQAGRPPWMGVGVAVVAVLCLRRAVSLALWGDREE